MAKRNASTLASDVITILLVEDDPSDVELIQEMLAQLSIRANVVCVDLLSSGLAHLGRNKTDIVLLDMNLPDSTGLETLTGLLESSPDVPVVVLTGLSDDAFGMEAVKKGAQDYLVKGEIDARILNRALHYAIERHKLEAELKRVNEQLFRQATTDVLTGVYNRLKFNEVLGAEIKRVMRHFSPLSLIMLDIDHFKGINDTFGHSTGDRVLQQMAQLLKDNLRKYESLARWGGEEFMILVPDDDLEQASQLAERLRGIIEQSTFSAASPVTGSFGVTQLREDDTIDSFINRADDALYRAKKRGRNRVETA
jgi:diguanylate cyclase (GGDEF)-like protein